MDWRDNCYQDEKGRWFRKDTGKQTYPSQEKRRMGGLLKPDWTTAPTADDQRIVFALKYQFSDLTEIPNRAILRAIMEIAGLKHRQAATRLDRIWRAGLLTKFGAIDERSGRLKYVRWQIGK